VRSVWLGVCLCLLFGCAATKVYVAGDYAFTGKVAVLPIANESNDLDGPIFVRTLIYNALAERGFQVLPLAAIDAQLKTQGFTDGGQLGATTPQKIGAWTGADTLFYTTLENFDYINVGVYAQRRVKILSKLVDAKTGERLWESEREGSTRVFAVNKKDAETLFAAQLAIKAIEKAAHRPLQPESQTAVGLLIRDLPIR